MDKRLEKYLQAVAHELRGFEPEQREAEIREMRGHLEAIVARLMEGGASEQEAVEAATAQFGPSRKLGRELEKAGASRESWRRILLAPVCGLACQSALLYPLHWAFYFLIPSPVNPPNASLVLFVVLGWLVSLSSGAVAGFVSPRWGGRLLLCLMSTRLLVGLSLLMMPLDSLYRLLLMRLLFDGSGILVGSYLGGRLARRLQGERASGPTEVA